LINFRIYLALHENKTDFFVQIIQSEKMIWWMIKLIFRPVRLIFLLTFFWIAINILKDENSKTQDPEEIAWCKEYKPNLSFEECSNEFGY